MRRVIEPLREMGAEIESREGDRAPIKIQGGHLHAIDYTTPVPSAQVKSAILPVKADAVVKPPVAEVLKDVSQAAPAIQPAAAEAPAASGPRAGN